MDDPHGSVLKERMAFPDKTFFDDTVEKWLIATLITITVLVAMQILKSVFYRKIVELSEKTAAHIDDLIAIQVKTISFLFLLTISIYFGSMVPSLPHLF